MHCSTGDSDVAPPGQALSTQPASSVGTAIAHFVLLVASSVDIPRSGLSPESEASSPKTGYMPGKRFLNASVSVRKCAEDGASYSVTCMPSIGVDVFFL